MLNVRRTDGNGSILMKTLDKQAMFCSIINCVMIESSVIHKLYVTFFEIRHTPAVFVQNLSVQK